MLYRLVNEIKTTFNYSEHTARIICETIEEQLVALLEIYIEPNDVQRMVEMPDYEGHNLFWYLDNYDIYGILDCRILDRIIQRKWQGPYDISASFVDFSTGYMMLRDPYKIFASDRIFEEMRHEMFTLDRSHHTHDYKFEVWKHSMKLRGIIDLSFAFFVVAYF